MNEEPRNGTADWLIQDFDFVSHLEGWDIWRVRHPRNPYCDVVLIPSLGPARWRGTFSSGRGVSYNSRESEPHVPEAVLNVALALRDLISK